MQDLETQDLKTQGLSTQELRKQRSRTGLKAIDPAGLTLWWELVQSTPYLTLFVCFILTPFWQCPWGIAAMRYCAVLLNLYERQGRTLIDCMVDHGWCQKHVLLKSLAWGGGGQINIRQ